MASVPFESLQGQPQRIFPVHDLDNGISYDQALRVTNAMQDQLHILERTSGNFPFPNRVPKYINEKVRRYSAEFQAGARADAARKVRRVQGQSLESAEGPGAGTPRSFIRSVTHTAGKTPAYRRAGKAAVRRYSQQQAANELVEAAQTTPATLTNPRVRQLFGASPQGAPSPTQAVVPRQVALLEEHIEGHQKRDPVLSPGDATIGGSGGGQSKSAQKRARAKVKRKGQGERSSSTYGGRGR
jgi:hypothetical protein